MACAGLRQGRAGPVRGRAGPALARTDALPAGPRLAQHRPGPAHPAPIMDLREEFNP
jgi:hypothetical protein